MLYYNYVTGDFEDIPRHTPVSTEQRRNFIPQTAEILNVYDTYINMGIPPHEATYEILLACSQGRFNIDHKPSSDQENPPPG
jgi:hypothetical protein